MYYWCNLLSGNPLDQGKFSLLAESINIGNNNNNNNIIIIFHFFLFELFLFELNRGKNTIAMQRHPV